MIQGKASGWMLLVLLLPVLVFVFFLVWVLYWVGDQPAPEKATRFEPVVLEAKNPNWKGAKQT